MVIYLLIRYRVFSVTPMPLFPPRHHSVHLHYVSSARMRLLHGVFAPAIEA
jgi:hypothetical protein